MSRPKLSEALFAVLEQELAKGPVAHGWPDQTWTLSRIKMLIGRRFHKSMTLSAIAQMLHRHGFRHQIPGPLRGGGRQQGGRHRLGEGDLAPGGPGPCPRCP
ncbi:winged helix-turn-helix domain-containing protein [Streptomyces canus]